AEDLNRFLNGEPVQARPVGTVGKAWRWCRRNPVVASFAGTTLVLLLGIAIGSPIALVRIAGEKQRAIEKLRDSYLAQAQARRFDSLDALRKAAEIRPSMELRNEAIACMALTDIRVTKRWRDELSSSTPVNYYFDDWHQLYVRWDFHTGTLSVGHVADEKEV